MITKVTNTSQPTHTMTNINTNNSMGNHNINTTTNNANNIIMHHTYRNRQYSPHKRIHTTTCILLLGT